MVIYPYIIFIYITKLIKTSPINQKNSKFKLNYNNSKSNNFLNEFEVEKYYLYNYNNENPNLKKKKIKQTGTEISYGNSDEKSYKIKEGIKEFFILLLDGLEEKMRNNTTMIDDISQVRTLLIDTIDKRMYDFNLSDSCFHLLNYSYQTFFNNSNLPIKEFVADLIINVLITKNDFISFDKCIQGSELIDTITKKQKSFEFHPVYFFTLANKLNNNTNLTLLKKSTVLEKNYFSFGMCFIESKKLNNNDTNINNDTNYNNETNNNNDTNNYNDTDKFCHDSDYLEIIKLILNFVYSINDTNFETFKLKNKKDNFSRKEIFIDMIPFSILLIPLFIRIVLSVCKNKIIKKRRKGTIIPLNKDSNPISASDEDNDVIIKSNESSKGKKTEENEFQLYTPNWYKLFNDIFNFRQNLKELFNLSDKNFNNNLGLSYTNALTGISMFLTIIGQTYFILYNLPIKIFGIWSFYNTIYFTLYIPLFIGLRYSPRIIFSCSGYTLAYKYLSFIAKKPGYYFGKFILLQTYKYFILILVILVVKYSLYHIKIIISENLPSWEIFLKKVLQEPESKIKIFLNLITFKIYDIKMDHDRVSQDIFSYFWIPLNEIFFFIFGTILISLGHSCRIRIDYGIIALTILLYFGKIIYYYVYYYQKEEIYTTLYYYMFEYGKLMLNPLFNLPSFLIGMYFGLINYSIQRGISESNRDSDYSKIYNIKENKKKNEKKEISLINFNAKKANTNNDNIDDVRNSINIDDDEEEDNKIKKERLSKKGEILKLEKNLEIRARTSKSYGNKKSDLPNIDNYKGFFGENNQLMESISVDDDRLSNETVNPSINNLEGMPFLSAPIKIKTFMRNTIKSYIYYFILIIFLILMCLFTFSHIFFIWKYSNIDFSDKKYNKDEFMKRLSLEKVITNKALNFFYLIDIELFIFFSQFILFYLYMRGHETIINGFFSHIYWSFFNKIYFSFVLVINPIILYHFYESDSIIKLNAYTIYLYSFINIGIIFVLMIICFIYLELPLKKLSKYYIRKYEINEKNENDGNDESEDENE